MANMHQFQADMLKIMCSQAAEVNNNEMQGIDGNYGVDCKSPREIPRTALGENIETGRSQGGADYWGPTLRNRGLHQTQERLPY